MRKFIEDFEQHKIIQLNNDRNKLTQMSNNASARGKNEFSLSRFHVNYLKYFNKLSNIH